MRRNERFTAVLLLAFAFTLSFCSAAAASSEPNAVELVRAVRESENWLGRIDSLRPRIEGKWSHPPESIAVRRAKFKKQYPDQEPDLNRNWELKANYPDILEYAIDFKSKRLRYVEETPGKEYFLRIWDGKQAMRYIKTGRDIQQDIYPTMKMFGRLFGSISWPRAQPHSFWWEPLYVEERMGYFGLAEDFEITGRQEYRGVMCHVLECTSYLDAPVTFRWYVGLKDHLLYGRKDWRNPEFVFEHWTLDYKQVAPGCLLPMIQGYSMSSYNPDTKQHYIDVVRDVRIVEARVNEELPDELFQMKFEEGLTVIDDRSGKSAIYNYRAIPPSLIGKSLPVFENINFDLNPEQAKDEMLLVCFWDMNQRPSRNCIARLAKQAEELKEKDLAIVAVQASKVDENTLHEWVKENNIPFAVGMIQGNEEKTRFSWGVKSLPWLILTDHSHVIHAEGFGFDSLDNVIEEINNVAQ